MPPPRCSSSWTGSPAGMDEQAERVARGLPRGGRARRARGPRRGRAPAPVEGAQVRVRRLRPDLARLHGDGRRHPAHQAALRAPPRERDRGQPTACASATCSTPATAISTRTSSTTRASRARRRACVAAGGEILKRVRRGRRLHLRRARHRAREDGLHAAHLLRGRSGLHAPAPACVQSPTAAATPARSSRAARPAARPASPTARIRSKRKASPSASSAWRVAVTRSPEVTSRDCVMDADLARGLARHRR